MPYISTRDGRVPPLRLSFEDALVHGLAQDGGLYVPDSWPRFDRAALAALAGQSYAAIAAAVTEPFIEGTLAPAEWRAMVAEAVCRLRGTEIANWLL